MAHRLLGRPVLPERLLLTIAVHPVLQEYLLLNRLRTHLLQMLRLLRPNHQHLLRMRGRTSPAENGYFFRKMPDGSYDQTVYVQNADGAYVPHEG